MKKRERVAEQVFCASRKEDVGLRGILHKEREDAGEGG